MGSVPVAPSSTRRPDVAFLVSGVPPPAPLYIQRNDRLTIGVAVADIATVVFVNYRLLLPDGTIVSGSERIVNSSVRLFTRVIFTLAEGYLLSVSAIPSVPLPQGACYVQIGIWRGPGNTNAEFSQLLASGYATPARPVSYPGGDVSVQRAEPGNIRSITGTDPAAGVEISETVPTGASWRIISFTAILTTDGTVATRTPTFVLDDGTNIFFRASSNTGQIASQVWRHTAAPHGVQGGVAADFTSLAPLPIGVLLSTGHRIRTVVSGIQAGDNWSAPQFLVEEWLNNEA